MMLCAQRRSSLNAVVSHTLLPPLPVPVCVQVTADVVRAVWDKLLPGEPNRIAAPPTWVLLLFRGVV